MSLIIIIGCIWGICKLISAASAASKERARQAQLERIRREQERVKLEQARQREAWKAAQEAERERVRQMVALEREQARQAKEQEKQAVLLEKHEKRISDLEFKVAKVERNIEDIDEKLADYYAQLDSLLLLQSGTVPGSKQFDSYQSKIVTKRGQIRREETKRFELLHTRDMAQKELEVA